MTDKPTTLPPASDPFPGSKTPGWNDPPTLEYNPSAGTSTGGGGGSGGSGGSGGGRPRLNLNKRVAFPLQGLGPAGAAAIIKPTAVVQPNLSGSPAPPPAMPLPSSTAQSSTSSQPIAVVHPMPNANAPPFDASEITLRILREQSSHVQESLNVRCDEIERRLGIIEQLWTSGNLSVAAQQKLYQLAKAIAAKSFREAMDTYTSLVVNHSNECVTWVVALRHIVLTFQPATGETHSTAIAPTPLLPPLSPTATTTTTTTMTTTTNNDNDLATLPAVLVPAMPRAIQSNNEMVPTGTGAIHHTTSATIITTTTTTTTTITTTNTDENAVASSHQSTVQHI